jgi:hypothetical protein
VVAFETLKRSNLVSATNISTISLRRSPRLPAIAFARITKFVETFKYGVSP